MDNSTSHSVSEAPGSPAQGAESGVSLAIAQLQNQVDRLLRAVVVLAIMLALGLGTELWQCWRLQPAAAQAAQLRLTLQQISATADEFRKVALRHPELAAIGRKYGMDAAAPASTGSPIPANSPLTPPAARP